MKMGFKKAVLQKSDSTKIQFLRSLVVGGIATGVDVGIAMLLIYGFSVNEQLAAAIGFTFGLVVNYLLSALWVFRKSQVTNRFGEFVVFTIIGLIGLGLKVGLITLFVRWMEMPFFDAWFFTNLNELIRNIAATMIVFIFNFAARKLVLYRYNPEKEENKEIEK